MRLCSKLTPHKSTWSADEAPFISAVFPLGTRRCAERLLLIWKCDSLSNSFLFKSKIMKHGIYRTSEKKNDLHRVGKGGKYESNKPQDPWSALNGSLVLYLQQGCPPTPPHPYTALPCLWMKMPPLYTQQPRGALIRLDIQTAATQAGKQLNILDWSKSQ